MTGYSRIAGNGRISAGENDQIWLPRDIRPNRVGVVLLHGSGNPDNYMDPITQPHSEILAATLTSAGISCVSGAMGYQTWANDTALNDVNSAWSLLASKAPIRTDKIAVLGLSMGGAIGARFSQTYPSKVAAFAGLIPLLDLNAFYARNSYLAEIATAWGVTSPAALPSSADIAGLAWTAASVPAKFWYSSADVIVLESWIQAYASVVGAQAIDVGNNGHSDTTIGQVPIPDVAKFLLANGC